MCLLAMLFCNTVCCGTLLGVAIVKSVSLCGRVMLMVALVGLKLTLVAPVSALPDVLWLNPLGISLVRHQGFL